MGFTVLVKIDTGGPEPATLGDADHTFNCAPMFTMALGRSLRDLDQMKCRKALPILDRALDDMNYNRERYEKLNPPNGWGDYHTAIKFIEVLRDLAANHPNAYFVVTS